MRQITKLALQASFLAALFASSCPAFAQADRIKIGNELKKTSGIVTELVNADTACNMMLKDEKGTEFMESADFDICFQKPSLIGKRVSLKYRMANVMAESCQGNPDCKKSDRIALVVEAKIIGGADAKSAPAKQAAASQAAGQTSFCSPSETIVFACRAGAKLVSVCASNDAGRNKGYLQYRFGKPNSRDPLELMLPEAWMLPAKAAAGETVAFAGGGGAWLRFTKSPFSYVVYTGIGKWGPKGETAEKQGIVVERGGKVIAKLKCADEPISELGPDWFDKVGITSGGQEFLFPD